VTRFRHPDLGSPGLFRRFQTWAQRFRVTTFGNYFAD
jgi:hypothetical protein